MTHCIADLHCDLLLFLSKDKRRTPYCKEARASIPQLQAGGVTAQVLALYSPTTKDSVKKGKIQFELFNSLCSNHAIFCPVQQKGTLWIIPAIENASLLSNEEEKLELAFVRLEQMQQKRAIFYISLTWNEENRFGGGAATSIGLKSDGKRLLDFLSGRKIAIDLSHASDALAHDILDYIGKQSLSLAVMASHSNFRKVHAAARNLPDSIAKEILARKGIIGLNFISSFVGPNPSYLAKQLEHALSLGAEKQICFGADFFYEEDISSDVRKPVQDYFYPDYGDASVYPKVLSLYQRSLGLSASTLQQIAFDNFHSFYNSL